MHSTGRGGYRIPDRLTRVLSVAHDSRNHFILALASLLRMYLWLAWHMLSA